MGVSGVNQYLGCLQVKQLVDNVLTQETRIQKQARIKSYLVTCKLCVPNGIPDKLFGLFAMFVVTLALFQSDEWKNKTDSSWKEHVQYIEYKLDNL